MVRFQLSGFVPRMDGLRRIEDQVKQQLLNLHNHWIIFLWPPMYGIHPSMWIWFNYILNDHKVGLYSTRFLIQGEPQSAVDRLRISSTVARGRGRSLQKRVSAASKAKTNNNLSRRLWLANINLYYCSITNYFFSSIVKPQLSPKLSINAF
jgi:hypothetical protein